MNTYSKSTSEFHEHTFEAATSDVNEHNNDTKHSVSRSKALMKKGTAATRLAARKKSAAKKLQMKEHAMR